MKSLAPKLVKRVDDDKLRCSWEDGFTGELKFSKLREMCPCALCQDERERKASLKIPKLELYVTGKNEIDTIAMVGNYAIRPIWKDGHDVGIYTWQTLREIYENFSDKIYE